MRALYRSLLLTTAVALALPVCGFAAEEVVVYSSRTEDLIKPLFDKYTAETGVTVRYVTDGGGPLLARLKAEGANTPADMLITVDAGNLWQAAQDGVLAPVTSPVLTKNVPAHLHDPEGRWYGVTLRARTIAYSTKRVDPATLSTYEDLADPKWKGRLCLRTSKSVYSQSLIGMTIARLGEEKTESMVKGWVANLAVPPFANDTRVLEAIDAGQCDVGIVNTYYFGGLIREKPALAVALFWPNQAEESGGVHVNVAGAGVTRYAKHAAQAQKLLEWLTEPEAQEMFAGINLEYPVNPAVKIDPLVAVWGSFRQDPHNVSDAGALQAQAVKLMDRADYR
ncbi:MAG: extracellular solute-binding protein [Chromatiales bacterium]|jgi:iron(III) transport system substrate-binding protein|nr:extracellular solute-binding protein [Chromatiales bacterium]